jgi:hypothetical protein
VPDQGPLIHYRCVTPAHQQSRGGTQSDTLTIHEGKWAYCAHDIRAKGHEWADTGGKTLDEVRRLGKASASQ